MVFLILVSILFFEDPLPCGREGIKMASACTQSANEQAKGLILVHTVLLKPIIKAQISGRMVSGGISDVMIASVHSKKTRLKKCMMIIIVIIIKKGDVGMVKHFSKEYGNKGRAFN